ncbi:MAG TPA: hypothetical protein VFB27_08060 [Opitutaceae bacterium]|nr:hypothetical protein [Opitutaceae bacterium]
MNAAVPFRLVRAERIALFGGGAALLFSVLLAWHSPQALEPAYRFAAFSCLGPAVGSLLFLLIFNATGGQWGEALRPFLAAGARLLPWIWLLILPLLFFAAKTHGLTPAAWRDYFGMGMVATRSGGYAVVFFIAAGLVKRSAVPHSPPWLGPGGLIVMVFMLHLLAQDWIASLQPDWFSTAFPIIWIIGQAVSGIAGATLAALAFGRHPAADKGGAGRALGLDWGNLMLAASMFWCYVAFGQFLIIWAGNMPSEISWYVRRSHGGWAAVIVALAVAHFFLPLLVLLSRRVKRSGRLLGFVAGLLLLAQWLYLSWLILPAFAFGGATAALSLTLLGALGGFFLNRYLAGARRQLEAV